MSRLRMCLSQRPPHKLNWSLLMKASWSRKHLVLAAVLLCTAWLAAEWFWAPNGTLLFGPLFFVWYGIPGGSLFVVVLFPCLFAYVAKPNPATAAVSLLALMLWLLLGKLGGSIGC